MATELSKMRYQDLFDQEQTEQIQMEIQWREIEMEQRDTEPRIIDTTRLQKLMQPVYAEIGSVERILCRWRDTAFQPREEIYAAFPANINRHLWIHVEEDLDTGRQSFWALGELQTNSYFYFVTSCGRDGFGGEDSKMSIWFCHFLSHIVQEAMLFDEYKIYVGETEEEFKLCIVCCETEATMGDCRTDHCADCYWEERSKQKLRYRRQKEISTN